MSTPVSKASSLENLVDRAAGYGIEREQVDGMDVLAVQKLARRVVDHVRAQSCPYFIEAITYRYLGHGAQDPDRYRTKQEIQEWRQRDCIERFGSFLLEERLATQADIERIRMQVEREVEVAIRFAEESPEPALDALYEHVYT